MVCASLAYFHRPPFTSFIFFVESVYSVKGIYSYQAIFNRSFICSQHIWQLLRRRPIYFLLLKVITSHLRLESLAIYEERKSWQAAVCTWCPRYLRARSAMRMPGLEEGWLCSRPIVTDKVWFLVCQLKPTYWYRTIRIIEVQRKAVNWYGWTPTDVCTSRWLL